MTVQSTDVATREETVSEVKKRPKKPPLYKVLLLNDDYTPMDFVVVVLQLFFHKNLEEATEIMLRVHKQGIGVCGLYSRDIAETKVRQVLDFAAEHQHPLRCKMERE